MWESKIMYDGGVSIYWLWGMLNIVYSAERVYSWRWEVNYGFAIRVSKVFLIYEAISMLIIKYLSLK
jgi:hypothetical protein